MWTCTLAWLLLRRHSLYESQVPNRLCSPAHTGELAIDLLQALTVGEWMNSDVEAVDLDAPLTQLVRRMADAPHTRYPVLAQDGRVRGVLDVRDVLTVLAARGPAEADQPGVTARDIMDPHFSLSAPNENLHDALLKLDGDPHGMLLVVDDEREPRLLGIIRRQDVLHAYHQAGDRMLTAVHRSESGEVSLPSAMTVGEAMTLDVATIGAELPVDELELLFQDTGHHGLAVTSPDGDLLGIVTLSDLERARHPHATALDIATRDVVTCFPFESVLDALRKFGLKGVGRLPVMDPNQPTKLLGMLRRGDVIAGFAKVASLDQDESVVRSLHVPQAQFIKFTINSATAACGQRIRDLTLPADSLVVSVRRGPALLVPHGDTILETGDVAVVLAGLEAMAGVRGVFG
jgi:CIC family chloride channel protein